MNKVMLTLAAALLALTAVQPGFAQAPPVDLIFDPTAQTVDLGNQATVDVIASGLSDGQFIGAFDVTVGYDDNILDIADVAFSNALGDPGLFEALPGTTDLPGSINANNTSLLFDLSGVQSPPADLTLFSLTFNTIGLGTSPLSFDFGLFSDDFGFSYSNGQFGTGAITVEGQVIPEPGTWLLMASGLALLALRRKRK